MNDDSDLRFAIAVDRAWADGVFAALTAAAISPRAEEIIRQAAYRRLEEITEAKLALKRAAREKQDER